MRRPEPFRLLLATLVSAVVAGGWMAGCGQPLATDPDTGVALTPDAAGLAPDAATPGNDASLPKADAAEPGPADASSEPPDAAPVVSADATVSGPDASAEPADADVVGPADAAEPGLDAAAEPPDAALTVPLPGFGTISGTCGVLDDELSDGNPYYIQNKLDFGTDPYDDPADRPQLTTGGQKIMADPNAGGSSKVSEAFSVEMLARCELAKLLKTEMEIVYTNPQGKLTDELVEMDALKIGVSVTRAMSWPDETVAYSETTAAKLVSGKLQGILDSTANVSAGDKWVKQVLYILAQTDTHAATIKKVYDAQPATLKADTIVIVTVTEGADLPVYYDP